MDRAAGPFSGVAAISGLSAAPASVVSNASWLRVLGVPAQSAFSYYADPNGSGVARGGRLTVTAADGSQRTLDITQAAAALGAPAPSVTPVSFSGETVTLPVQVAAVNGASSIDTVEVRLKSEAAGGQDFNVRIEFGADPTVRVQDATAVGYPYPAAGFPVGTYTGLDVGPR